jgi:hypothetical protein
MIICRKCSRRHPDGTDFCTCGAFLEFDGERAPDEMPASPVAPMAPSPPDPAEARVVAGGTGAAQGPGVGPESPWSGLPGSGNWADPPATTGIEARPPDEPLTGRPGEPVVDPSSGRAGDNACARCGTPNAPERQFCQHCGQPLVAGVASAVAAPARQKVRWGRRIRLPGRLRTADPQQLAAQARRLTTGGMSSRTMLFRTGGVMVILAGVLAFLGPWRGTVLNWTKDRVGASRYEVVDIGVDEISVEPARRALQPEPFPLQGPDKLLDRKRNTAWATHWLDLSDLGPESAPAGGQCAASPPHTDSFLRIVLPEATDLARLRIQSGRAADDTTRQTYLRPRLIEARMNGDECQYLELADEGELEVLDFRHKDVKELELRVLGVYADPESVPTAEISELILERRR